MTAPLRLRVREGIEAALHDHQRRTLHDLCDLAGVPRDRWDRVPALRQVFVALAAENLAALQRADGMAEARAADAGALRLGASPDTIATIRRRWFEYAYRDAA